NAAEARKQELLLENDRLEVRSPSGGIVLAGMSSKSEPGVIGIDEFKLSPGKGEPALNQNRWCRIAYSGRLQLTVPLNADDHETIQVGTPLRFHLPGHGSLVRQLNRGSLAIVHPTE
ncbi:unnamed protein product, partial [Hapterophycus canaliculatus]